MPDEMKVQVKMSDDAKDFDRGKHEDETSAVQYQVRIAEIEIEFRDFDGSLARDNDLRDELQLLFQRLADERFGGGNIVVEVELRAGSLIVAAVLAIGVGGYKFFKDYEQLHKGAHVFAEDLKAARKKIEEIIRRHSDKRKKK
jgi:hypothetical protein